MIEYLVIRWLYRKNTQEALESGHRPFGYGVLTVALWFGMEIIGATLGFLISPGFMVYLIGLSFAAIGGFISRAIVSNLKQGNYIPRIKAQPITSPARITVVWENSYLSSSSVWDIFLNGANIGRMQDGASLTVMTNQRNNVLTAKDSYGGLSQPFGFFVESEWHLQVMFKSGRFEKAQRIAPFVPGLGQSAAGTPQ